MELRDYLKIIRRHLWVFLAPVLVSVLFFFANLYRIQTSYQSHIDVVMSVKDNRWNLSAYSSAFGERRILDRATVLASLKSDHYRTLVTEKINSLHPDLKNIPFTMDVELGEKIQPLYLNEDTTFILRFTTMSINSEVSTAVLPIIVETFETYADALALQDLERTKLNLMKKQSSQTEELNKTKRELESLKSTFDIYNTRGALDNTNHALREVQIHLLSLKREEATLINEIDQGKKQLEDFKSFAPKHYPKAQLKEVEREIFGTEATLTSALSRYTEDNPTVKKIRRNLEHLRALKVKISKEEQTKSEIIARMMLHDKLVRKQSHLETKISLIKSFGEEQTSLGDTARELVMKIDKWESKNREVISRQKDADKLTSSLNDLLLMMTVEHQYVNIISKSKVPQSINKTNLGQVVLILVLGLVMGMFCAYLVDLSTPALQTEHDVKKYLGMPVSIFVPKFNKKESPLISSWTPYSAPAELFKSFAQMLVRSYVKRDRKVLQFTSPEKFEGKSTMAINVAVAMAMIGKRVLLMDNDLKNPSLAKYMKLKNLGIVEYLAACEEKEDVVPLSDYIQETDYPNLKMLAGGARMLDTSEIFDSPYYTEIFKTIRKEYDVIIVDTPPVALTSDSIMIASHVDAIFFVLSVGLTNKHLVQKCKDMVEFADHSISGVILNRAPAYSFSAKYYQYGYYYYSSERDK